MSPVKPLAPEDMVNLGELFEQVRSAYEILDPVPLPRLENRAIVGGILGLANDCSLNDCSLVEMTQLFLRYRGFASLSHDALPEARRVERILEDATEFTELVRGWWTSIVHEREEFRHHLEMVISDRDKARSQINQNVLDALKEMVIIPKPVWTGHNLTLELTVLGLGVGSFWRYALMLLLDESSDIGQALRRCRLSVCNRFFLSYPNPSGGPRPAYCEPGHRIINTKLSGAERTARWREKQQNRRSRK